MEAQRTPDLIPWIDAENQVFSDSRRISAGLEQAARFCRFAYVVAAPWRGDIYPHLKAMTRSPITIIPGLRVSHQMPGDTPFHDRGAWHDLAYLAHRLSQKTRLKALVLDAEQPLYPYWSGARRLDHEQLHRALEQMPDLEYLWHPGGLGSPTADQARTLLPLARACWETVQSGLRRVKFTTVSSATLPAYGARPWIREFDDALRAAARVRPQEMICLASAGDEFWPERDIRKPLALMRSRDACLRSADMPATLENLAAVLGTR